MRGRRGAPTRLLATVFFTDMVGSTERASELGDRRWREVLARYHRIVAQALRSSHGREVDRAGDGFFAVFEQPADAVDCADEIARRVERLGIQVRSGVHLGQVEVQGNKVSGIGVHIGARLVGLAGPGEVLVSSTVRDALAGSDHTFIDRGAHALKGVVGEWRIFALVPAPRQVEPEPAPVPAEAAPRHRRRTLVLALATAVAVVAGSVTAAVMLHRGGASPQASVIPGANQVAEIAPDGRSFLNATYIGVNDPVGVVGTAGHLWVIDNAGKTLTRVDESTLQAQSVGTGGSPLGIAYAVGSIWVTVGAPGQLLRFDATDFRQMPSFSLTDGDGVHGIAPDGRTLWVTNDQTNQLLHVDTSSGTVDAISVGREPSAVAVTSDAVWVVNSLDSTVSRVDKRTGKVTETIEVHDGADVIAADDNGVWVAGTASHMVTHIDPMTYQIVTTVPVGAGPVGLALTRNYVWVAESVAGQVERIDPSRGATAGSLMTRGHPSALSAEGGSVWVTVACS